jgi:hypothetical protein
VRKLQFTFGSLKFISRKKIKLERKNKAKGGVKASGILPKDARKNLMD